jgi:hypothetical protein
VTTIYSLFGVGEGRGYIVYQWLQCYTKQNLRQKCRWISIIYPIWGWRRAGLHCLSVTTMSHQAKSVAQITQNFLYSLLYSLFGDGQGQGYTVCMSVHICQSNQWNSAAWMFQNFHYIAYYIAYLGMEKGGVTLSVRRLTFVSQTNGILRHECRRISIIHCILVTTMCHQW